MCKQNKLCLLATLSQRLLVLLVLLTTIGCATTPPYRPQILSSQVPTTPLQAPPVNNRTPIRVPMSPVQGRSAEAIAVPAIPDTGPAVLGAPLPSVPPTPYSVPAVPDPNVGVMVAPPASSYAAPLPQAVPVQPQVQVQVQPQLPAQAQAPVAVPLQPLPAQPLQQVPVDPRLNGNGGQGGYDDDYSQATSPATNDGRLEPPNPPQEQNFRTQKPFQFVRKLFLGKRNEHQTHYRGR